MPEQHPNLDALRKKIKNPLHKSLLEAYEKGETSDSMIKTLIKKIQEQCDEINKS